MKSDSRRPPTSPTLLRLVVAGVLAATMFAITAPAASAARPCWKDLVDDYWADNRVDKVYPISCYRDAMEALPRDVKEYSDAQDDLRRALLIAIRNNRDRGENAPVEPSEGSRSAGAPTTSSDNDAPKGFFGEVIDKLGPKNASSVPVPLLVLATIALLLIGAAGASYAMRWYQARRITVAPPEPRP